MTNYVGQTPEGVEPISDIERQYPHLIFTEYDRARAWRAIQNESPVMDLDLYVRLRQMSELTGSFQAAYFVEALHNKARKQGQIVLEQIIEK